MVRGFSHTYPSIRFVATLHPHALCALSSFNCDCEKLYHTINSDSCHMKDQLRHGEGVTKVPLPWFIPLDPLSR